jgi:hypothetical protein
MARKIIPWAISFFLCMVLCWQFRYELLFFFQYKRIQSIGCTSGNGTVSPCRGKFWVHRVNSLERFKVLSDKFGGFEADIVFDDKKNCFWVCHPPLAGESVLSLKSFLEEVVFNRGKNCWLDTRFVNGGNVANATLVLEALDKRFHIKDKIILELYDPVAADYLAHRGFTVSMNIPAQILSDTSGLNNWKRNLSPEIHFVSQADTFVGQLKKEFPGRKILTWSLSFENYIDRSRLVSLAKDSAVAVILLNIKSRYYK